MPNWRESVVLLTSTDPDNPGFGTGFVFHRDATDRSFLLTCLHVVATLEKSGKGAVGEPPGILAADRPAEVWLRGDSILDLAVLAVDGLRLEPLRLGSPTQRGTPIETAGFSEFEKNTLSVVPRLLEGTVRDNNPVWSRRPKARQRAWSLDIEIDKETFRALAEGYSGSPVVDPATGSVVGIMNLKWSGSKGHALCVRSCTLFDKPLTELPDYAVHGLGRATLLDTQGPRTSNAVAAEGALGWLASTLNHADPIERVARRLRNGQGHSHPNLWFYAFDACHADYPRALADHLAVQFGALPLNGSWLNDLVTELYPVCYDEHGLWNALAAKIAPPGTASQGQAEEADRILRWMNAEPMGGAGPLRVVYCALSVADQRARIPGFIAGSVQAFSGLRGLRDNARVLFLFACIFEEDGPRGLSRLLDRWSRPRIGRLDICEPLGAMAKLSLLDLENWLGKVAQGVPGGRHLDIDTQKRLREALEPLFASDAARLRYKQVHRPARDILTRATLAAPNPGDTP